MLRCRFSTADLSGGDDAEKLFEARIKMGDSEFEIFPNYYRTERNTFRLFRLINVDACFIVGRIN